MFSNSDWLNWYTFYTQILKRQDYFSKWKLTNRIFCQGHQLSQTVRVLKCSILTMYSCIILTTKRNIMTLLKSPFFRHSCHWWLKYTCKLGFYLYLCIPHLELTVHWKLMINLVGIADSSKHALQVLKKLKTIVLQPPFNKYTMYYTWLFLISKCVSLLKHHFQLFLEFILYWNTWLRKPIGSLYNSDAMV